MGIGGWAVTSSQVVWFAETWTMQDVRRVWPCLSKPAQRYIACFETLAQLALLQATHSHIGGGHYSPSGTDNSAAEAGINKMFTTSWPLQIFVQLVASWAHAKNVLLQPTHLPGRYNEWADDLSRPWTLRPPPCQSRALQPCRPCTSWKGHHTLPRRGTMAPRTYGCSRRACVTHGLLAVRLQKASAARSPSAFRTGRAGLLAADGRVCAQTPSIRKMD